jgi:putative ABC transport system permease protein
MPESMKPPSVHPPGVQSPCLDKPLISRGKHFSPAEPFRPFFYLPFTQRDSAPSQIYFLLRTPGDPTEAIGLLRRAVAASDPAASAFHAAPLAEYTQVATFGRKVAATFMAALGLMCLVLAGSGLYSVMAYAVSQRIPEIGIRMAMGATPMDVIRMDQRQGMAIAAQGMPVGAAAALASTRLASSMLVGVQAADPMSVAAAGLFLAAVALFSTWLPAVRATRTDPMAALRR